MNLTQLAAMAIEKRELEDSPKRQRAVRQKLQRILEEMPTAQQWNKRPNGKGDWDIPEDAADAIIDSEEFWAYVYKLRGQDYRALAASIEKENQEATQAWLKWMDEREEADSYEDDPYYPSPEQMRAEETTMLLCGIVGLIASENNKTFSIDDFRKAHEELAKTRAQNDHDWNNDHECRTQGVLAERLQQKKLSDLRNFFV